MNALKLKFTSGNDIPVERAIVTRIVADDIRHLKHKE